MDTNDIGSVAKLGVSLGSCLELHSESGFKSRQLLPKLVAVVNSTALTLGKIQHLIQENGQVFTEAGVNDIESLTTTCRKIYNGILIMLVQHTRSVKGDKDVTRLSEGQAETLLACVTYTAIWSHKSWDWLELRLKYCQHLLTQVKFELMIRYLLGCIANHQLITKNRVPGDFNTECSLVMHLEHLAPRWRAHHKHISEKMAIWNKVDSPAASARSSFEDFGIETKLFGKPGNAPSKPCSITTTVCDVKTVEVVTSAEVKTPEPTTNIEVAAEANEDEQIDNKIIGKDEHSLTSAFKSWLKRLLLPDTHEWKDQDLEVWQVDISLQFSGASSKGHRKLDIDDRQILSSLAQTTSCRKWKKRPELIEQYASLDQRVRRRIDEAIDAAKQSSSRERTWIAMSIINEPFKTRAFIQPEVSISLFFRLGQEIEPIYILDAQRGKIPLPYASCSTPEMIKEMLVKVYWHRPYLIQGGNFVICTWDEVAIAPEAWESIRRPGMVLKVISKIIPPFGHPSLPRMCPPVAGNVVHASAPPKPSKPAQPRPPKMKPIHLEMKEMLQVSYPFFPEEAFKIGLGELLALWTNAIDCFIEPESDESSADWPSSSTSLTSSSDSDSSMDIAD